MVTVIANLESWKLMCVLTYKPTTYVLIIVTLNYNRQNMTIKYASKKNI